MPIDLMNVIKELTRLPKETEWAEFKLNYADSEQMGRNLSALSNSAALLGMPCAYMVWGIDNSAHEITGTTFNPKTQKVGNEELENWLLRLLDPKISLVISEVLIDSRRIILFEIGAAPNQPVRFRGIEYIRIGSYTKKLHDFPEKERDLWRFFDNVKFEDGIALNNASSDEILELINYPDYFQLLHQPLPDNRQAILTRLCAEKIIITEGENRYGITNIGAILFARNLQLFHRIARKALRVIIYKGSNRTETVKEQLGGMGYAIGFERAITYINDRLPQNEQVGKALRREVRMYPEIAIRELVANALIHQDFNIIGAGPTVEIFIDRMEITNPGTPLINTLRFIDEPPRSRNEALASLMRRMAICEERGSGIDKVISSVEAYQLPAPDFRVAGTNTIAVLFGAREFLRMNRDERIRACYQHSCLQYVSGTWMSNASLRKRLGIKESNYPMASRIIKDAINAGLVRARSGEAISKRDAAYIPFWA